jgi:hypothetical protein
MTEILVFLQCKDHFCAADSMFSLGSCCTVTQELHYTCPSNITSSGLNLEATSFFINICVCIFFNFCVCMSLCFGFIIIKVFCTSVLTDSAPRLFSKLNFVPIIF